MNFMHDKQPNEAIIQPNFLPIRQSTPEMYPDTCRFCYVGSCAAVVPNSITIVDVILKKYTKDD